MFTPSPCLERLQSLFDYIGSVGFGANASTGRGQMRFEIREEQALFEGRGARAMSLSHGILTGNMYEPKYKQHTHFGRLGGHFASGSFSPFKYPILMMRPGATFRPADEGPFGKLVPDVHHDPALHRVRQHAMHLPCSSRRWLHDDLFFQGSRLDTDSRRVRPEIDPAEFVLRGEKLVQVNPARLIEGLLPAERTGLPGISIAQI